MSGPWLIIDDIRTLKCDIIARTAKEGKAALLKHHGLLECLVIDHDLGEAEEETGYDVIKWAIDVDCLPPKIQICSANPVGRQNIEFALFGAGYTKCGQYYLKG